VLDPLGSSQILPYLERLHARWPIHILSFERPDRLSRPGAVAAMQERLARRGLRWTWLRYHRWPSLPATAYDVLQGVVTLRRIISRERPGLIHCRHYLPMTIASKATSRLPLLFDIRGLQAEEYVDGGIWRQGELKWHLAKRAERQSLRRAAGAVVLTENIRPYIEEYFTAVRGSVPPLRVIPCCVDLERFRFRPEARAERRAALRVGDDITVFVYAGSMGTWYLPDAMARYVRIFRERTGRRVCLLWLINNAREQAEAASRAAGLASDEVRFESAPADDVPDWLSAGDVGLALIKPCFSKRASSPTKYAEYLAIGLPVLTSREVGDSALLERQEGAVGLAAFDDAALAEAVAPMEQLLPRQRSHFRALAERLFNVDEVALPAYRGLYEQLMLGA
jgi:glycosyltransferase involved in cell wall biosynthesis